MTVLEALVAAAWGIMVYYWIGRLLTHWMPATAISVQTVAMQRAAARIARRQGVRGVKADDVVLDVKVGLRRPGTMKEWPRKQAHKPEQKNREKAPVTHHKEND